MKVFTANEPCHVFYGLDVDLSKLADNNAVEKEVGDEQEIEF
jgi:hypothetical protein